MAQDCGVGLSDGENGRQIAWSAAGKQLKGSGLMRTEVSPGEAAGGRSLLTPKSAHKAPSG